MKVAVIGSRSCENFTAEKIISRLPDECTKIISGGARGVDDFAAQAASSLGIPIENYLPEYEKYGRNAPLKRNIKIIEDADMVLAFWDFHSRGTARTIAECVYRNIPVRVFGLDD